MKSTLKALSLAGLVLAAPFAMAGTAKAEFVDPALYCSATPSSATLDTSQMTIDVGSGSTDATDCYGAFSVKEAKDTLGTNSEYDVLAALWGDFLVDIGKWDGSNVALNVDLGGLTITGIQADTDGTWGVTWVADPATTLPAYLTLAVLMKAANGIDSGSFLFERLYTPFGSTGGSGEFTIGWTNNGGNIPDLSHLSLAAFLDPVEVPEPASLTLLGIAVFGIGAAARRRMTG